MSLCVLIVCLVGLAAPAVAVSRLDWPPDPSLIRNPREIVLPQDDASQELLRRQHDGVQSFLKAHPTWRATIDPFTGSLDRAFGEGLVLEETTGETPAPGQQARGFFARHRALFAAGIEDAGAELVYDEAASRELAGGTRLQTFDLHKDGLEVLGAGLTLGLKDNRVVLISSSALGPVTASTKPKLEPAEAFAALGRWLQRVGGQNIALTTSREPALAIYPVVETRGAASVLRHHLVWILEARPEHARLWESHIAWIDAHDGEVLAFFPEARNAGTCTPDPKQTRALVAGGVRPNLATDPETVVSFPYARVEVGGVLVDADRNGRFPYTGGTVSSTLEGSFFRVHCDNCAFPTQPVAGGDPSGDVDFGEGGGSAGPPTTGNGTSTPADRTTYFHLNQARQLLDKWDNAFFNEIDAYVNIDSTCNAFSSSYILGFFHAGGGCRNTGEIRDVVHHELGHTWDRFDGNEITNGAMSEWKGDLLSLIMSGDSCVGESFSITSFKTTTCNGVRDIDERASGRTDHPVTPGVCPTCATLTRATNNCGTGSHCLGEITGQASWHLLRNLLTGADYITGAPLPAGNPALPPETARWILERLMVAGGPAMQTWDPLAAGVSVYDALMLMDDDDANLANGTPHAAYINAAFSHHGVAESPLVPDSAGCAPLSDPVVTAAVETDARSGLPTVRIDWTPVGGATSFDVFRNTRAGDAFLPLARNVASGPILDTGVMAGAVYRYFVAAVRTTGCAGISPAGNIIPVTVTLPQVRVQTATVTEVPGGSDLDGRVEPGETVAVNVRLAETAGAASATGVTASLAGNSTASPVTSGGPVTYGTVPAGSSTPGPADFKIHIGPSESCGGKVHAVVSASGNEGCWLDSFDIAIDSSVSCAVTPSAFVEVVPGSVQVTGANGDADGIADNCEGITVGYQIRNIGSVASGPAVATVTSPHAGLTFAPAPAVCAFADLGGGATGSCQFTFSLAGAGAAGVPFMLTTDSAGNAAPSRLEIMLGAESNPYVFSTRSFGFEGSLEGWTAQQFSLSGARFFSGAQSARSGSTAISNICGKLTSPAFLLHPAAGSTLSFRIHATIEPLSDFWYDRANVHIIDLGTGKHTLLTPSSGLAYNASGNPDNQVCHVGQQNGWGGLLGGFSSVAFDLSAYAGRRVRIEINYDTDEGDNREGIYIDDVVITNVAPAAAPPDLQTNSCIVPEVSSEIAAVPLDVTLPAPGSFRFEWQDLGGGFQYNLYSGTLGFWYDHGSSPVSCGGAGTGGVFCNGTRCTLDVPEVSLPGGSSYFLTTATAFGLEGTAGFASAGPERNPAQNTCAP